jgi:hypothetical protein
MLLNFEQILDCLHIPNENLSLYEKVLLRAIIEKHRHDLDFESIPDKIKQEIRDNKFLTQIWKCIE